MDDSENVLDSWEQFLQANARPDIIAAHLREVIRDLMRAASAKFNYSGAVSRAATGIEYITKLQARCQEPCSSRQLLHDAVEGLRPNLEPYGSIDGAIHEIASTSERKF